MSMMKILTILKEFLIGIIRVMEEAHSSLIKVLIVFKTNITKEPETLRVIL